MTSPWPRAWVEVRRADRLIRLHLLFFTALWLLLGAVSIRPDLGFGELVPLIGVACCFHVFAYVLNDVVDLPIDRTQPQRRHDPLVTGEWTRGQALALALAAPFLSIPLTRALGGGVEAHAWFALACCCMAAYNVWGKRCPLPPLTDAIQGLGWGALALYAARSLGAAPTPATWQVASAAIVVTMFINGIYGSFRDLANDLARGARTTAIWLGARPTASGNYQTPPGLAIWAWMLLTGLLAVNGRFILRNDFAYGPLAWTLTASVTAVTSVTLVCLQPLVLYPRGVSADIAWRLQMYLMVWSLPLAFAPRAGRAVIIAFVLLNVLALVLWNATGAVARWLRDTIADEAPAAVDAVDEHAGGA